MTEFMMETALPGVVFLGFLVVVGFVVNVILNPDPAAEERRFELEENQKELDHEAALQMQRFTSQSAVANYLQAAEDEAHRRKLERTRKEVEMGILTRGQRRAIREETNRRLGQMGIAPYRRGGSRRNWIDPGDIEDQVLGDPNTYAGLDDDDMME